MKIINYILIFIVLACIGFIYILINRINDLKNKVNNISVTTGGNVDIQEIENKVNQAVLDTIEPINSSIRRINNDIQSLSDQGNTFSSETSNIDDNIYQRARLVSADELGYEIDNYGNLVFNKPVRFNEDVNVAANLNVTENLNVESTLTVDGDAEVIGDCMLEGENTINGVTTFNNGIITQTIKNFQNNANITFISDGAINFKTQGRDATHNFGKWRSILNNMAIDRHNDSDDYFTIFHKNGGNTETKYSLLGTKGDNGHTVINSFNNNGSVQIRRNNNKLQGRLECTVFRPTALIPKGNGTQDGVNYSGITTTTDGWNNLKISRFMCSAGAKNNDVVLVNIQRGNTTQIHSEWAQIFNGGDGYKYVRTFGFNNAFSHELKFNDNNNTRAWHALNHHLNNWYGSYVTNCRIRNESDWKKEGHMDSFLRSYGNNQNY